MPRVLLHGLGQDTSTDFLTEATTPVIDTSVLGSPLLLAGVGLLGVALLLQKGGTAVRGYQRKRKRSKQAAINRKIAALEKKRSDL